MAEPAWRTLRPHPGVAPVPALGLQATCAPSAGGVRLRYRLSGALDALRLPAPVPAPAFTDGLWQGTCLEAFFGAAGDPAYHEFNFSPSGNWAAYRFSDYRRRDAFAPARPALRRVTAHGEELLLEAELPRAALPAGELLEVGLCAVLETRDGALGYWALAHPCERPDFHRRAGFCLRLALSTPEARR